MSSHHSDSVRRLPEQGRRVWIGARVSALGCIGAILMLSGLQQAHSPKSLPVKVYARGIASVGEQSLCLELRDAPGSGTELVAIGLVDQAGGLELGRTNRIFHGADGPLYEPWLRFAMADDERWLVAGTLHTGGPRWVTLWTGLATALTGESKENGATSYRIRQVVLDNIRVPEEDRSAVLSQVFGADAFVWRGQLHLFGAGLGDTRPILTGQERIWRAVLPDAADEEGQALLVAGTLRGAGITDGVDPRIVVRGDEAILAVRAGRHYREQKGDSPLLVFRSMDLVGWTLDEALSAKVQVREGYSLHGGESGLWLATPVAEGELALARIWRHDADKNAWVEVPHAPRLTLASPDEHVWLVPSDRDLPALLARDAESRWTRHLP